MATPQEAKSAAQPASKEEMDAAVVLLARAMVVHLKAEQIKTGGNRYGDGSFWGFMEADVADPSARPAHLPMTADVQKARRALWWVFRIESGQIERPNGQHLHRAAMYVRCNCNRV